MHPPSPDGPNALPTTNWTDVTDAAAQDSPRRAQALDRLLRRYWRPLWAHLVYKRGVRPDRAEDLVQAFIGEKILKKNLLAKANPALKLRTYLLTALDRVWIDNLRREEATRHRDEERAAAEAELFSHPAEVAWAMQVFIESVKRMRAECQRMGRLERWGVFVGRALTQVQGKDAVPFEVLAQRLEMRNWQQAANRYQTAAAMFHRILRAELASYAGDDLEEELGDLVRNLSRAGPELLEQLRIHLWGDVPEVTMSDSDPSRVDAVALCRLLELPPAPDHLAACLQQALAAPVRRAPADEVEVKALPSIGDLLHQGSPLLELLERAKCYAREQRTDPESPLRREVATVLYYASIAVALVRCGRRITRCDDNTLALGFQWGCEQQWVDEAMRGLLRAGLQMLRGAENDGVG
jgi:DNA-directed RNA polymerase specialized sigma24 family protein